MSKLYWLLLTFIVSYSAISQPATKEKMEVLLLGTFHFDNPGLDVAQYENADVLTSSRQKEILEVVKSLKAFRPDMIFIEATPGMQGYYDSLLQAYKNGHYKLQANEIDQLGFRLAKEINLPKLICVDYRDAAFPFDSLVKVMMAEKQTDLLMYMKAIIDSIESKHNEQLKRMTIREMLIEGNTKADRDFDTGSYFEFLKAGSKDNHIGSYLVSEWWRRNMVIYENILKNLGGKDKRILVLFGGSHTALLHEFMKYNQSFKLIEVTDVLN